MVDLGVQNRVRWFISVFHTSVFVIFCTFKKNNFALFMMHLSKIDVWYLVCRSLPSTSFFHWHPVTIKTKSLEIVKNFYWNSVCHCQCFFILTILSLFTFDARLSSMLCTFGRVTDVSHPHPFTKSRTLSASLTWACPSGSVTSSYRMIEVLVWIENKNIDILSVMFLIQTNFSLGSWNITTLIVHTLSQHWNIASHALREDDFEPVIKRQSTFSWVFSLSDTSSLSWKDCTYFAIFIILTW